MIFRQFIHDDLGCASYLIGDEDAGIAAVIDPKLDVDEYLRIARYMRVSIRHILETHNHADHVSGHGRLAAATGATIHVHRLATPDYPHEAFDDGWELELGRIRVRAIHTPGHRPEHTAFALIDDARGPEPWAVLTGDTLFVGDIARPDLAVEKEEGARGIFHSLHDGLLKLPATCEVWPGHLGGSMCGGAGMDMKVASTIGYESEHQPLLAIDDVGEFVRATTSGLGPQPPNFQTIVALNRGPLHAGAPVPEALPPHEVDRLRGEGVMIVDVRSDDEFDAGHIGGAVSVPASNAGFGTKLAWVARGDVVLVGGGDDDALEAAELAAATAVAVRGHLAGGMTAWRGEARPVTTTERLPLSDLPPRVRGGLQVLDVREEAEWDAFRIPGSVHTPYHDLDGVPEGLDPARPIAVVCGSGQRATVGASLLSRHGAAHVVHVVGGGVPLWKSNGWPVEAGEPAYARG